VRPVTPVDPAAPVDRGTPAAQVTLVDRADPVARVTRADLVGPAAPADPGDRAMAATEVTAVTVVMAAMAVTVVMEAMAAMAATAVTAVDLASRAVRADLVDPAGLAVPNPAPRVRPVSLVDRVVPADPESRAAMDQSPGQPVPGRTPGLLALMPMRPRPMAALEPAHRRTLADRRWDPITRAVATCRAARVAATRAAAVAATRVAVAATQAVAAATQAVEVAAATRNRRPLNRFRRRGSGRSRCS
jgi:hypothetical protein